MTLKAIPEHVTLTVGQEVWFGPYTADAGKAVIVEVTASFVVAKDLKDSYCVPFDTRHGRYEETHDHYAPRLKAQQLKATYPDATELADPGPEFAAFELYIQQFSKGDTANTVTKKKVDRDGGGLGKFHVMTLEEAKALPRNAEFWCITPHDYVFSCKLVGVPQIWETNPDIVILPCSNPYGFSETSILKGHLFVEEPNE